ncbi:hypothetical protein [Pseudomonas nitroreducens]|uniref:hypothetical protein n=1 Tax=Pseudomonas nitroreducens TaxID=46680 RepID=UPI00351CD1C3
MSKQRSLMQVNVRECEAAGLDPKAVRRIAAGLSRYAREASALGLEIFGGSGTGELRTEADARRAGLVLARLDGEFNGGDGASEFGEDGLLRGESC